LYRKSLRTAANGTAERQRRPRPAAAPRWTGPAPSEKRSKNNNSRSKRRRKRGKTFQEFRAEHKGAGVPGLVGLMVADYGLYFTIWAALIIFISCILSQSRMVRLRARRLSGTGTCIRYLMQ
jgi:hypothetical protein